MTRKLEAARVSMRRAVDSCGILRTSRDAPKIAWTTAAVARGAWVGAMLYIDKELTRRCHTPS